MSDYTVEAKLTAKDVNFTSTMEEAEDSATSFGEKFEDSISSVDIALGNLVAGALSKAIDAIGGLVSEALDASDSLYKFEQTMSFAGFDDSEIQTAEKAMKDYADLTIYELGDVMNTTAQLAANGIDNYQDLAQAAGNLNAVAGGNADTFKSVAQMLTQTAGAGKLTTENWNQLSDAIPGASGKVQEALRKNGAFTGDFRDAMAKGEITAEEFNQALLELGSQPVAQEAATSVETFEGAMGNLKSTVINSLMDIIDTIGMENITDFIQDVGEFLEKLFKKIQKVVQFIKRHGTLVKTILVGIGAAAAGNKVSKYVSKLGNLAGSLKSLISPGKAAASALEGTGTAAASAGKSIFSSLGFWTALASAAIAVAVALAENDLANDELYQSLKTNCDAIKESKSAWEEFEETQKEALAQSMGEISNVESLSDELENLVDANGRVKEGYEERANFIIGELNDALGTEISMTDGVIDNYEELIGTIDDLIEKKRVEAILNANQAAYDEAIANQEEHMNQLIQAQEDLNRAKAEMESTSYTPGSAGYQKLAAELEVAQMAFDEATAICEKDADAIAIYTHNSVAAQKGDLDDLITDQDDFTAKYSSNTSERIKALQNEADEAEMWADIYQQKYEETGEETYRLQAESNREKQTEAEESMKALQSTTDEGLKGVVSSYVTSNSGILGKVQGLAGDLKAAGIGNASALQGGMTSKVGDLLAAGRKLADEALKGASGADMESVGYNMAAGLASGIDSGKSSVISSAAALAVSAVKAAQDELGIHSPSRVMAEVGDYTVAGFVNSLVDGQKDVSSAMEDLIQLPNVDADGYTLSMSSIASIDADADYMHTASYTIEVPINMDGKEVAKVTAPYTEAELTKRQTRASRMNGVR